MGGAERNARKKKQEQRAAKAVASARGANADRTKVVIGVVVVLVLAVAVIGGVIWSKSGEDEALQPPAGVAGVSAPVAREGGVVVVGKDTAKATIDVYEDFLCPACGQFKKVYGTEIKQAIEAGTLRVRYHAMPFLVRLSDPEGYSRDSANAALCAADEDKFWQYHESLFAKQPKEGGPGYTKQELVKLGTDLGIGGETFKTCVEGGTYDKDAQAELSEVQATDYFKGTPTVAVDGRKVDVGESDWLANLLK